MVGLNANNPEPLSKLLAELHRIGTEMAGTEARVEELLATMNELTQHLERIDAEENPEYVNEVPDLEES